MGDGKRARDVVGRRFRDTREALGLSRAQVARAARNEGLRWTGAAIEQIERGQRALDLEDFAMLPVVLCTAQAGPTAVAVTCEDLLTHEDSIELTNVWQTTGSALRRLLHGPITDSHVDTWPEADGFDGGHAEPGEDEYRWHTSAVEGLVSQRDDRFLALLEQWGLDNEQPERQHALYWVWLHSWSGDEVTAKIAKRLHRQVEAVAFAAAVVFGRSIPSERDRRCAGMAFENEWQERTLRGRVTRVLREEVERELLRVLGPTPNDNRKGGKRRGKR